MVCNKFYQALNNISDSVTKAAATPKEIKIAGKPVLAESIPLTSKDIYRAYWHCRDFEIAHLWQRSVFLTAFIVLCFSAYGYLAADMLSALRTPVNTSSDTYWLIAHGGAIFISLIGTTFSLLWITMAKASKAWTEVYESAIAAYEQTDGYVNKQEDKNKIGSFQFDYLEDFKTKINEKKFSGCILKSEGGAYSPSRINWAIGSVTLCIWTLLILLHIIGAYCVEACWGIGFILISVVCYVLLFVVLIFFVKSKTLSNYQKYEPQPV